MFRKGLNGVLAAAMLVVSAQSAQAQFPSLLHFNVNGGASMPMSDAGDVWNAGLRVGAGLEIKAPIMPIGVRVDGAYDRMGLKLDGGTKLSILSGTVNGMFTLPVMPIYAVGGIGMYRMDAGDGATSTEFGFNAGVGMRLPLPFLPSPFVEARLNQINGDGGNFRYVPIVAGIRF